MRVRQATESDARAIAEVHVASWQQAYRGMLPDWYLDSLSVEKRLHGWTQVLRNADINTFVAESDGNVVGFANLLPSRDSDAAPNTGELGTMYVLPSSWGQGCGRALMRAICQKAIERAFDCITLWVLEPNCRARRFYEATGFVPDGSTKTETTKDGVVFHVVRYRLVLAGGC